MGFLYLLPTTLGDNEPMEVLPFLVKEMIEKLDYFIVENEKTARKFIKRIAPGKSQPSLTLFSLDKYADKLEVSTYLDVCAKGISVGLLSEAGVPAIADPGAEIVKLAHQKNIRVIPLVGPSSIILAMMA
ncbi:MAG: SAM-dependent methyltransferase, partial [Lutibacter sp.]|nr:SAM-dependent methyltransferase [Lutibacter sp.]